MYTTRKLPSFPCTECSYTHRCTYMWTFKYSLPPFNCHVPRVQRKKNQNYWAFTLNFSHFSTLDAFRICMRVHLKAFLTQCNTAKNSYIIIIIHRPRCFLPLQRKRETKRKRVSQIFLPYHKDEFVSFKKKKVTQKQKMRDSSFCCCCFCCCKCLLSPSCNNEDVTK